MKGLRNVDALTKVGGKVEAWEGRQRGMRAGLWAVKVDCGSRRMLEIVDNVGENGKADGGLIGGIGL